MFFNRVAMISALLAASAFSQVKIDVIEESKAVDRVRTTPEILLEQLYNEKQIIFLGQSNHDSSRPYQMIHSLLEKHKNDKEGPIIVLERPADQSLFYERFSMSDPKKEFSFEFKSKVHATVTFCRSAEWAFSIARLLPYVSKWNSSRNSGQTIVMGVDGSISENLSDDFLSDERAEVKRLYKPGNCSVRNQPDPDTDIPAVSRLNASEREERTMLNFEGVVWNKIKNTKRKVIVLYHILHLLQNLELCLPFRTGSQWSSNWATLWLDRFFHKNPEAKKVSSVIFLDGNEIEEYPATLVFLARHGERLQEKFAMRLPLSTNDPNELGESVFTPKATVLKHYKFRGRTRLSEMANAVSWNYDPDAEHRLSDEPAAYVGEQHCPREE